MKSRVKKDYAIILLSFLIATVLWGFVQEDRNPERETDIKGIPVTIVETGMGPSASGLKLLKGEGQTISVRVRGKRNSLTSMNEHKIKATVNLSGMTKVGEYELPIDIDIYEDGVSLVETRPARLMVRIEKMVTVQVPVRVELEGLPAGGYYAMTPEASPAIINVTGPQAEVNYIDHAKARLSINNYNSNVDVVQQITLYNKNGEETKGQYITADNTSVNIALKVYPTKTVPIEISTLGAPPEGRWLLGTALSADSVTIAGSESDLAAINSIRLDPVDLSQISESTTIERAITMPKGIVNVSGSKSVVVSVEMEGYATSAIEIPGYMVINVPSDLRVSYDIQRFTVTLYGPASKLNGITPDGVVAYVDMSEGSYEPGNYELPISFDVTYDPTVSVTSEHMAMVNVYEGPAE